MKSESPLIFWLLRLLIVFCLVVASLLLFVVVVFSLLGCVVGGFLSLRMVATKRKGAPCWCVLSLFVCCVMRLLIVRGLPAIPFQLLRGSVRNCSNVGGLRHKISNLLR